MRIGISVAQCDRLARPAAVSAAARAAEQLGYSSVWVCDSLLDPAGVLAATAAMTDRVRLGASLHLTAGADPASIARSLATVDLMSDGRLSVALAMAPGAPEHCLDEVLDALDALDARGDGGGRPTVLLDGREPAALDRVARRADGWAPAGLPVARLAPLWAGLRDLAAGQGRDPDRLQLVVPVGIVLTEEAVDGPRASYQGDLDQVAEDVDLIRRVGAHEVVLSLDGDPTLDQALDGYARIAEAAELRGARIG
ncbi:MAG: LLM class flavin-dependent oxidoreductase [Acidimicrobiales bacterium]